jgi:ornithine carbamoyltransferase
VTSLLGKDLITTQDWSIDEINLAINLAKKLKNLRRQGKKIPKILDGKIFSMLFYGPSTRTRGAFESGMSLLGGHAPYIDVTTTRIKAGETVKDAAEMYNIYGDGIGVRALDSYIDFVYGKGREIVEQFAKVAKIPVINMACCTYHPTQAIGDIITIQDKLGKLKGKKYVIMWGYSSQLRGTCSINAEALIATRFGMDVVIANPTGFGIDPEIVKMSKTNAKESGGSLRITHDFNEALLDANVVFPRSWVTSELRKVGASNFGVSREIEIHNKYRNWRLTQEHVDDFMSRLAIVTHVLQVFRGEEASDEVMDGPNSVIIKQAEDNFYAKMAVLSLTMARDMGSLT